MTSQNLDENPHGIQRKADRPMKKLLLATAVLALCAGLAGCTPPPPPPAPRTHLTTVPTTVPTPADTSNVPLAQGIVQSVYVQVFAGSAFRAAHGCGCTIDKSSKEELFPENTPVVMLRIAMSGSWSPGEGSSTTQDVTGINLKGTKFDGRPEDAVLDTADGPTAAGKLGIPWMPAGLFTGKPPWLIQNDKQSSFVAAWYVPQGVNRLQLTVNTPSEGQPLTLAVNLPDGVLKLLSPGGE